MSGLSRLGFFRLLMNLEFLFLVDGGRGLDSDLCAWGGCRPARSRDDQQGQVWLESGCISSPGARDADSRGFGGRYVRQHIFLLHPGYVSMSL